LRVHVRRQDANPEVRDPPGFLTGPYFVNLDAHYAGESFSQALHVLKGDSEFVVTITDFSVAAEAALALAQQLATKILARI
jgi:hypothetical protein